MMQNSLLYWSVAATFIPIFIFLFWPKDETIRSSPDGSCTLRSAVRSFGSIIVGGVLGGYIWAYHLMTPFTSTGALVGIFITSLWLTIPLTTLAIPFWKVHLVVLQRNGRVISRHLHCCAIDKGLIEYLFLPDNQSLLVAQSGEYYWRLYRYDLAPTSKGARRPVLFTLGHPRTAQQVTFEKDWLWLEELWRACGVEIDAIVAAQHLPEYEDSSDPAANCRSFFAFDLPRLVGFPVMEYRYRACQRALACIPAGSTAFNGLRAAITAELEELAVMVDAKGKKKYPI